MILSVEQVRPTEAEAIAAVREQAFVTDEGRSLHHCFLGSFGADWDTESVVAVVERADQRVWVEHLFAGPEPCLAVSCDGKVYVFDTVRKPAEVSP